MAKKKIESSIYTESIREFIKNNPDKAAEYLAEQMKTYYGFNIQEPDEEEKKEKLKSFAPPVDLEGALITGYSAFNPQYVDFGAQRTNDEIRLIDRYREMALSPECESAIEDIINEFISIDEETNPINIVLDEVTTIEDSIKDQIREEFDYILNLFEFKQYGYDLIRKWYTDGRLYYHLIIDTTNEESVREGIQEVRYIDPRKIKKIKERPKKETDDMKSSSVTFHSQYNEYFLYSEMGFDLAASSASSSSSPMTGLKIAKDSVAYAHSGVIDYKTGIILSHLHKAIKPYNQLRMMEDATVIYRISRAPERRIFYIDIEGLTPQVAERYINNVADRFKNKLSYDVSTGEITNDRRYMCYALDTKIPLLDGRTLELQEIMKEYEQGKTNWVYSCDPVTGKFVPGPISWAGITKRNTQVVKVTFDNGKSVICTPDHKFPVWGKGFVEAKDLVGQSIIPGYRRQKELFKGQFYEQIYRNEDKKWVFTHREVAKWKDKVNLREEFIHKNKYVLDNKNTIHHKDFNRFNNSPENLLMMNKDDHIHYHWDCAKFGAGRRKNKSEDFTPEWRKKLSEKAKLRTPICKTWNITYPDGSTDIIENLSQFCRERNLNRCNIKNTYGSKKYFAEQLVNHKAISVEWLSEKIDTGCITIDQNETYHSHHTYLLDAGVYTKNTMLEDFFLGQRDGKGTNVTSLPGGQNLGEMEDVEYFRRKLYKALNVPITRLEAENSFNLGRPQEITRDEVKFSKFIKRMRAKFVTVFEQALERHLILKGIVTSSEWETIRQNIFYDFKEDNHFTELREAEILTNRLGLLSQVHTYTTFEGGGYFSKGWVKKHVLRQDEKETKEIQKQIEEERDEMLEKGIDPNASTGIGGFGMGGMGAGGGMEDPTMGGMVGTGMPEPEMQGQFNQGATEGPPPASADMGNPNSASMKPNKKKR